MMMHKKFDWGKYVPAGLDWKNEFKWLGTAHGISAGFSLLFLWKYFVKYSRLFEQYGENKVLIPGEKMPLFAELYNGCMAGFLIVILSMFFLAALHYGMHFTETKSIYLMRRLPDRWDLMRRVWTIPALTIMVSLVLATVLTLVYLSVYFLATPAECLVPGQF